jgi:hypothetical protein
MKKISRNVVLCLLVAAVFMMPISAVKNKVTYNEEAHIAYNVEKHIEKSVYVTGAEWSKTYGRDEFDMLQCVQETDDGGFIACGVTKVRDYPNPGDVIYQPWMLKLDADGNEIWEWTLTEIECEGNYFNYFLDCYCTFVQQTIDGGYITCVGLSCTNNVNERYWVCGLAKLDESGGEEWVRSYAVWHEWSFHPRSLIELYEGGFLVTGLSGNYGIDEDFYACLLKTDAMGQEQWHKDYNYGGDDDETWAICSTNDNGCLITGWATTEANGADYWMIKTDANGNKEWDRTFGGDSADYGHCRNCYQTNDGGYLMCGYSNSYGAGGTDVWIVKTDSNGHMEWNKTYGYRNMDVCWSVEATADGGYVFCVTKNITSGTGDKDDIHLVKTDSDGNIEWVQKFDGPGIQIGQYISETSDGGFIVSGRTGGLKRSISDGLLIKFGPFENQRPNKPETPSGPTRGNPGTEYTFTASATDPDGDSLQYKWDWGDGNVSEWLEASEASYTWTGENIYNIRVIARDTKGGESDWSEPLSFSTPIIYKNPFMALLEKLFDWLWQVCERELFP